MPMSFVTFRIIRKRETLYKKESEITDRRTVRLPPGQVVVCLKNILINMTPPECRRLSPDTPPIAPPPGMLGAVECK